MADKRIEPLYKGQEDYINGVGGGTGTEGSTHGAEPQNNYYNLLKNESYKTMLRNNLQASAAKEQAQKYTEQALANQGFANQGLAESTRLGLQQSYLNALEQNKQNYSNELLNINEQQRQENLNKQNDDFQSITALMSGASSKEQLDKIMQEYNYGKDLDSASQKQLNLLYEMYSEGLTPQEQSSFSINDGSFTYYDKNGNLQTMSNGKDLVQEMNTLQISLTNGSIPNDSYIHLKSKDNRNIYLRYINGVLQYVNKSEYDNLADTSKAYYIYGRDEMKNTKQ